MSNYTAPPTWEQIEAWWMSQPTAGVNEKWDRKANFDAWRREHDHREVAKKAWDECWRRIMLTDSEVEAVNPYRVGPVLQRCVHCGLIASECRTGEDPSACTASDDAPHEMETK